VTATNHVLTGAVIGFLLPAPVALPLAFLSHFVLDSLPHYGNAVHTSKSFITLLFSDMFLASLFLLTLLVSQPDNWQWALGGGMAAASPDLMWLPHWLNDLAGKPKRRFNLIERFHSKIQWGERKYFWPIELMWATLAIGVLVNLTKN
jgi:hypothetical protein